MIGLFEDVSLIPSMVQELSFFRYSMHHRRLSENKDFERAFSDSLLVNGYKYFTILDALRKTEMNFQGVKKYRENERIQLQSPEESGT